MSVEDKTPLWLKVMMVILISFFVYCAVFQSIGYVKADYTVVEEYTYQVNQSDNDCVYYEAGVFDTDDTGIYMLHMNLDAYSGILFENITIPENGTIIDAKLSLYSAWNSEVGIGLPVTIRYVNGTDIALIQADVLVSASLLSERSVDVDIGGQYVGWYNYSIDSLLEGYTGFFNTSDCDFGLVIWGASGSGSWKLFNTYDYNSSLAPKLYVTVEVPYTGIPDNYELVEQYGDYTIIREINYVQADGLVNPNYWVDLPVTIEVPVAEVTEQNATTYNSTYIQPDQPYGEPWGNSTYEGNYYHYLYHTGGSGYQTQVSRCQSSDSGRIKVGIFGFERTWGTQTASNIPIIYIGGYSASYSGSFSNRVTNGEFYVGTEVRSYNATVVEVNCDSTTASVEARGADLYLHEGEIYLMKYWVGFQPSNYGGSKYNYHYRNNFYSFNQVTGAVGYYGHVEYHFNCSDYDDMNRVELIETYGGGAFDAFIECYVSRGFNPEISYEYVYVIIDEDGETVNGEFDSLDEAEEYINGLNIEEFEDVIDDNFMLILGLVGLVGFIMSVGMGFSAILSGDPSQGIYILVLGGVIFMGLIIAFLGG